MQRPGGFSSFIKFDYSSTCSGVNRKGRIIIRVMPMMLSDHSTDSELTNKAAIIKIVPGIMAINHDL
jgi:hypothetical protein